MVTDADRRIFNLYATTYVPRVYLIDALGTVAMLKIEYSHNTLTELIEYANSLKLILRDINLLKPKPEHRSKLSLGLSLSSNSNHILATRIK